MQVKLYASENDSKHSRILNTVLSFLYQQGLTNRVSGRPGQPEKGTGQPGLEI